MYSWLLRYAPSGELLTIVTSKDPHPDWVIKEKYCRYGGWDPSTIHCLYMPSTTSMEEIDEYLET